MKRSVAFVFLLLVSCFLFLSCCFAQNKEELEKKKKKLEEDINFTNELLNKTKETKATSLNELETLEKQITIRAELIENINAQIAIMDKNIDKKTKVVDALQKDLNAIKSEY